jgi:hypothetical protein
LPHSDIPGSQPAGGSPGLIAAIHVLHRLLVPRHPPCALASSASRSLELTKPAGSTFSKKTLLSFAVFDPARVRANGLYLSAQLLFDSSGTHPALLRAPVVALPPGKPHGQSVEAPRLALQFVPVLSRLVVCARRHKNGPTLSSRCGTHENSAANPMRLASPTV